jgi:hypothetical protein
VCNDCGLQLRSVKEAQDHGEVSGHSNFAESEEAVLTLVCEECGCVCGWDARAHATVYNAHGPGNADCCSTRVTELNPYVTPGSRAVAPRSETSTLLARDTISLSTKRRSRPP